MNTRTASLLDFFRPFLMLGFSVAILLGLLIVFAYLFVWGLILTCIFALVGYIYQRIQRYRFGDTPPSAQNIFIHREVHIHRQSSSSESGRVIDHDDDQ